MRPQHEREESKTVKVIYANEEQKAWDTFAVAVIMAGIIHHGLIRDEAKKAAEICGEFADAMMEQRKARMG